MNVTILVGRIGQIEQRQSKEGKPMATLRVATDGNRKGEVEWHDVIWFEPSGLIKHLDKGRTISIRGELRTNRWQGKDGRNRQQTSIIVREIHPVGGAK